MAGVTASDLTGSIDRVRSRVSKQDMKSLSIPPWSVNSPPTRNIILTRSEHAGNDLLS